MKLSEELLKQLQEDVAKSESVDDLMGKDGDIKIVTLTYSTEKINKKESSSYFLWNISEILKHFYFAFLN